MLIEATSDSFPPELTTKYMVSKVLGEGVCGEVRLGFKVPDLHTVTIKIICKRTIVTTFNGGNSSSNVLNKVMILQSVNHPWIINLWHMVFFKVPPSTPHMSPFGKFRIKRTGRNKRRASHFHLCKFLVGP